MPRLQLAQHTWIETRIVPNKASHEPQWYLLVYHMSRHQHLKESCFPYHLVVVGKKSRLFGKRKASSTGKPTAIFPSLMTLTGGARVNHPMGGSSGPNAM